MPRLTGDEPFLHPDTADEVRKSNRKIERLRTEWVDAQDWGKALILCDSQERLPFLATIWHHIPPADRPTVFAEAYSDGDLPVLARPFILRVLREFQKTGVCAFDCEDAHRLYATLSPAVRVWRGTVREEIHSRRIGTSWTLSIEKAGWFATQHGRFRNLDSPPCIISATVGRSSIGALLIERKEAEAVIHPRHLRQRRILPAPQQESSA